MTYIGVLEFFTGHDLGFSFRLLISVLASGNVFLRRELVLGLANDLVIGPRFASHCVSRSKCWATN